MHSVLQRREDDLFLITGCVSKYRLAGFSVDIDASAMHIMSLILAQCLQGSVL